MNPTFDIPEVEGAVSTEAASLAKVVTLVKPEATPDQANVVPFFVCAVVLTQ